MQDEFAKRNVKMVGYSCNDRQTHWHWIKTKPIPRSVQETGTEVH